MKIVEYLKNLEIVFEDNKETSITYMMQSILNEKVSTPF